MGRPSVSPLDLPTPQGQLARSLGTHMEIKLEYDCRVRRWLYGAGNPLAILKSNRKGRSLKGGRGGGGGRDGHEEGRQTTATAIREKMKKTTTEWGEKRGLNVNFRLRLLLGMSKMPSRLRFLRLPKLQSRSFRAARATLEKSRRVLGLTQPKQAASNTISTCDFNRSTNRTESGCAGPAGD